MLPPAMDKLRAEDTAVEAELAAEQRELDALRATADRHQSSRAQLVQEHEALRKKMSLLRDCVEP
jgi:hypothetical protein